MLHFKNGRNLNCSISSTFSEIKHILYREARNHISNVVYLAIWLTKANATPIENDSW